MSTESMLLLKTLSKSDLTNEAHDWTVPNKPVDGRTRKEVSGALDLYGEP